MAVNDERQQSVGDSFAVTSNRPHGGQGSSRSSNPGEDVEIENESHGTLATHFEQEEIEWFQVPARVHEADFEQTTRGLICLKIT